MPLKEYSLSCPVPGWRVIPLWLYLSLVKHALEAVKTGGTHPSCCSDQRYTQVNTARSSPWESYPWGTAWSKPILSSYWREELSMVTVVVAKTGYGKTRNQIKAITENVAVEKGTIRSKKVSNSWLNWFMDRCSGFLLLILCEVSVHMFVHVRIQPKTVTGLPWERFQIIIFVWSLHAPSLSFYSYVIMRSWHTTQREKIGEVLIWQFGCLEENRQIKFLQH